jgi:hypothetical protein
MVGRIRWISHRSCLIHRDSTSCPPPVHSFILCPHDVDATPADASLRCRAMSQTPTYDQLRGERINADVPASEADPQQVDHLGRHRLVDDPLDAAVCGQPPGSGADLADWSRFWTVNSGHPGKHRLHDDVPGAPAICGPSPGLPTGLVGGWSWFTPTDRARLANATGPAPPTAGTELRGQTHVADQQACCGQRAASKQVLHADLSPPAHKGDTHPHMAVEASRDARAGPPEAMAGPRTSKAPVIVESHWLSRRLYRFESRQHRSVQIVTEETTNI